MPQTAIIETCRRIVANHQFEEIDEVVVDATTANVVVQVYDALSPENQAKLNRMAGDDVIAFTGICMKLGCKEKRRG